MTLSRRQLTSVNYRVMENYGEFLPVPRISTDKLISPSDRILLLRLSAIGDAIRILPAVELLRKSGVSGRIDCAVEPPIHEFLEPYPNLDTVHVVPLKSFPGGIGKIWNVIGGIRRVDYDWVFDCHGLLKSGLVSYLSGSKNRVGYSASTSREGNYYFQTDSLAKPLPDDMPRVLKYIQLIRSVLPEHKVTRERVTPDYPELEPSSQSIRNLAGKSPILVHTQTSHSRYGTRKEWGEDNFVDYLTGLSNRVDRPIRLTWGPGEHQAVESIAESTPDPVRPAPETSSLKQLTYLIQNAYFLVTVDTSVAHIADLVGTPLVVVYGGSSYKLNAPLFALNRFVTKRDGETSIGQVNVDRVLTATEDLVNSI